MSEFRIEADPVVEVVRSRYVLPLREELAREVEGYEGLDWRSRFARVIALNAPMYGVGDCLPLGQALVFAGVKLGEDVIVGTAYDGPVPVEVRQYQPRFSDRWQFGQSYALLPEKSVIPRPDAVSRLHEFLTGTSEVREYETGKIIAYGDLPPAYRAALLALYLDARVVAPVEAILAFILGDRDGHGETLLSGEYMPTPCMNIYGRAEGWLVRIRATHLRNKDGEDLARYLRWCREAIINDEGATLKFWGDDEEAEQRLAKLRAPHDGPEEACLWVRKYELWLTSQGKCIGGTKRNGVRWEDVLAKLIQEEPQIGCRYEDAQHLRRQYHRWQKRHGLR